MPTLRSKPKPTLAKRGLRSRKELPDLKTMFQDPGDPLAKVQYVEGDLEKSATNEMSEVLRQLIERRREQREAFRVARDPDYFICVCFQSREQRDEFMKQCGWSDGDERYVNGLKVCRLLGIDVKPINIKPLGMRGRLGKYTEKEVLP